MLFSKRYALAKEFEEWRKVNNADDSTINVITFLQTKGLLKDNTDCDSPQLPEVRAIVNNVLFFDDSSDYESALWDVLKIIAPEMFYHDGGLIGNLEYIEV